MGTKIQTHKLGFLEIKDYIEKNAFVSNDSDSNNLIRSNNSNILKIKSKNSKTKDNNKYNKREKSKDNNNDNKKR